MRLRCCGGRSIPRRAACCDMLRQCVLGSLYESHPGRMVPVMNDEPMVICKHCQERHRGDKCYYRGPWDTAHRILCYLIAAAFCFAVWYALFRLIFI